MTKELRVENWNRDVRVGALVRVKLDDGREIYTRTIGPAVSFGGRSPVVWVGCESGCYGLSRVVPVLP